ncbi:TIGR03086 family metal-binding protein [Mycobacterium sp. OTB74]|jgi:uncharacterized protein (TIGR03086 family)|uniref:TIGR03086 family metal-binding protein n=1 Tax=Mycobacterium sp. OTB74 TaxID=1853452 RepID=UPI0024752576|nr:TIGR03086 family metal-binding protein [Mycobacterium sp. OTB74]MDH6243484.1 uncharacterized protein (TIGR03086 family) [Mycobacterium sp. OTB74]
MTTPADEIESAEQSLAVLLGVLKQVGPEDLSRQTPCTKFDVAGLTDHLLNSISMLGGAAGAESPKRDVNAPVAQQISDASLPTLAAWKRRGLEGTITMGPTELPANIVAGILSLELLVHAWDYASALGLQLQVPDDLADYSLERCRVIVTPEVRPAVGFDEPLEILIGASPMEQLIAFTGRQALV